MEDRVDKLHADFSNDSTRCVELQEEIKLLESEVAQQTTLKNTTGLKVCTTSWCSHTCVKNKIFNHEDAHKMDSAPYLACIFT